MINNHNYERYLDEAVGSALAQADSRIEVIVVDDGSTDGSVERLRRYSSAATVVLQEHRGQKAAFNAGFERATGDFVLFLDSDDVLAPTAATAVLDAARRVPDAARVVFRLDVIDERGHRLGWRTPPDRTPLPSGDVRHEVLAFPDDLGWPPTSGNAFAAWTLERVMPLPVDDERVAADQELHVLTPLFGPVVALPGVHGAYRVHDANAHARAGTDPARSAALIRWAAHSHRRLTEVATELGHPIPSPRSVTLAAHRLVVRKLAPDLPGGATRLSSLVADGVRAARGRHDVSLVRRLAYCGWFVAVAVGPPRVAGWLAGRALRSGAQR